ncbi:hypothetical protein SAY87_008308 [Trapa incisa]|uniref:pectinesterase n=1 Tax=Trapa incisa TaxID=236973 RepID=A0AAN7QFW1_9MYRT|nr:hypothetical protein SAY87_008308 [Trapa incisa]
MRFYFIFILLLLLCPHLDSAVDDEVQYRNIYVDPLAGQNSVGIFITVQAAIDSVPENSRNWVVINIKEGIYSPSLTVSLSFESSEKVIIPQEKPFIALVGKGHESTHIVWDDHESIHQSPTFTVLSDNIVVQGIGFRVRTTHTTNPNPGKGNPRVPATAAMVSGDKVYFCQVAFHGVQDTLWDKEGRHFFLECVIHGFVDFILGNGQSIYENCTIVTMGDNLGFITAQSRTDPSESTGFVFKNCRVLGSTTVKLGRPWRCHARVLFYNCYFASVIDCEGWDLWLCTGQERQMAFGEYSCYGHGADQTGRVIWEHKFSKSEVQQLTDPSFIGASEWLNQPWWLSLPTS